MIKLTLGLFIIFSEMKIFSLDDVGTPILLHLPIRAA